MDHTVRLKLSHAPWVVACTAVFFSATNALGAADVIVSDISGVLNYGTLNTCSGSGQSCIDSADCNACQVSGDACFSDLDCPAGETCIISGQTCDREITAFSIGTWSCNVGDVPLLWCDLSHNPANCDVNEHPVIVGNMYRLADNRIEQIGMSWVKHGFAGVDSGGCGQACIPTGTDDLLGVGCRDLYSPQLNANQPFLGPRSEINPATGSFAYPFSLAWQQSGDEIYKRVQVKSNDLNATTYPNAMYFVEGQYITPDDAAAGNGNNNVSYRPVNVEGPNEENRYLAFIQDDTFAEQPAIRAWQAFNPNVVETDVQIADDGLLILAADATGLGNGFYRYEYAIYNMNSDRAAGSFFVPLPLGAIVDNIGFHDVDYHSGEPYAGTDWSVTVSGPGITFETDSFAANANANAIRWGTLYNFRFDSNIEPVPGTVTIGLFKPGTPSSVDVTTVAPLLDVIDCNDNGIADDLDIAGGTSQDCDANAVPDECQNDCNANDVADTCDLTGGTSPDCNNNNVPDECDADCNVNGTPDDCEAFTDCNSNNVPDACDPDCNENGTPDDCEGNPDTDMDGVPDCEDQCRLTSPPGSCDCPLTGCCDFPGFPDCFFELPWEDCLSNGGTPDCIPSGLCRNGCLIGDWNEDAVIDFADMPGVQNCFAGPVGSEGFIEPSPLCQRVFDLDEDTDVDLDDYLLWYEEAYP